MRDSVALFRIIFFSMLLVGVGCIGSAQSQLPSQNANDNSATEKNPRSSDSKIMTGTPEAEMLARRDIHAAEKNYRENLERAREAAQLSTEIRDVVTKIRLVGRTEIKKLERLEKITRKIRNDAGGSDTELVVADPPTELQVALVRLAEVAEKLRKSVEKTPRQVVSASVIEQANEVLDIIRVVRDITR